MAERHFNEVIVTHYSLLDSKYLRVEFRDEQGVVNTVESKGSFVIVGRNGRKSLEPNALVSGVRVNIIHSPDAISDLFIQVLGAQNADLIEPDQFIAVAPSTAANLGTMKGQIERVQHNLTALGLLREIQLALGNESTATDWLTSVLFKVERGSANPEGKAAAPLLQTVARRMLPEIVARTIEYAEAGNKEAMAEIARLAEALKD